jgi:hypothetical protein
MREGENERERGGRNEKDDDDTMRRWGEWYEMNGDVVMAWRGMEFA